jgi:SAM-dependent methyltransferase
MEQALTHRFDMGHHYSGIPINACRGIHEYAAQLVAEFVTPGASVFDIGCGVGALTQRLHDEGYVAVGADIDARGYMAKAPHLLWDSGADKLPVPERSVDAVCAIEILEHVENPLAVLRNVRRILKPGGVLIVSTPNISHPRSRLKFLMTGSPSFFGPEYYEGCGHRTLLTDWILKAHIEASGFTIQKTAYAGDMPMGPVSRALMPVVNLFGRLVGCPKPDAGDGAATFFVATV